MIVALLTLAQMAQPACAPHATVAARLATRFGEAPQFAGLTRDGSLLEAWANRETGTWTLLRVTPDGTACLMASGEDWTAAVIKEGEPA